jgi:hypothetical protein
MKWGNCVSVKCYKMFTKESTYAEAKAACSDDGAKLASITSSYEQGLIYKM